MSNNWPTFTQMNEIPAKTISLVNEWWQSFQNLFTNDRNSDQVVGVYSDIPIEKIFGHHQNLIEGIDDEVVFVFMIFMLLAVMFFYYFLRRYDHFTTVTFNSLPSSTSSLLIDTSSSATATLSNNIITNNNNNNNNNQQQNSHNMFQRHRPFNTMDGNCPVCLNPFLLPVETNCGHLFCGQCIVIYWQQSQWRGGPIKCPVCRQQVNILLQCFNVNHISATATVQHPVQSSTTTETNNGIIDGGDNISNMNNGTTTATTINLSGMAKQLIKDLNRYNRRFSGEPRPWYDYLYDLPTMLRHLSNDFFSFDGLFYMFRIRVVICFIAAIMYLISPLDMIPEAVFGIFGLIDDIVVVLLLAIYVTIIYRRFLSSRWADD